MELTDKQYDFIEQNIDLLDTDMDGFFKKVGSSDKADFINFLSVEADIDIPKYLKQFSKEFFKGTAIKKFAVGTAVADLPENLCRRCQDLAAVNLSNVTGKIGAYAFAECNNLTRVDIPAGITEIDTGAFMESGITEVHIAGTVKKIGKAAFANCQNLEKVFIENGVEDMSAEYIFKNCPKLKEVYFPAKTCHRPGLDMFDGSDNVTIFKPEVTHKPPFIVIFDDPNAPGVVEEKFDTKQAADARVDELWAANEEAEVYVKGFLVPYDGKDFDFWAEHIQTIPEAEYDRIVKQVNESLVEDTENIRESSIDSFWDKMEIELDDEDLI